MKTFKTSDGITLAYHDEGQGTPVLCLAGLVGNSTDFCCIAPYTKHIRLIRLDMRGRGASDFDPNCNNYNLLREAADTLELLDHLKISQVAIIGTSRGGVIAMYLAATNHKCLLGVMLNDIGPVLETKGIDEIITYLGHRPEYKSYDEAVKGLFVDNSGFFNISASKWQQEVRNRWIEKFDELHLRYDPKLREPLKCELLSANASAWANFDALKELPVALVRGENSNLLSHKTVKKMQERHPKIIYTEVKDRGHTPFLDEPECLAVLKQFLKEIQ